MYEFSLKGFVLHVYIMASHCCLHWHYIMWAFLSQRLAALIKSLSTADQAKNKYIKNRLSFGSRISHIHHFYSVMLLFPMLLFYIFWLGKANFKQWVSYKPLPLIVFPSLFKVRDKLKLYMLQVSLICCVSQQITYKIEILRGHKTYELRKFSTHWWLWWGEKK